MVLWNMQGGGMQRVFKVVLILFFLKTLSCGSAEDTGMSSQVTIEHGTSIVLDSIRWVTDPKDPTLFVELMPNMFDVTFEITNNSQYKVVIASIKFYLTYTSKTTRLKTEQEVDVAYVSEDGAKYISELPPDGIKYPLKTITLEGLDKDALGSRYQVKTVFKGFFSNSQDASSNPIPLARFEKIKTFSVK